MATERANVVGSIASMRRYPVKSMQGEELDAVSVTERGLLGDRRYALLDVETGKIASAKNPKKWPGMFEFRADYLEAPRDNSSISPPRITLPGGAKVDGREADVNDVLSRAIGRTVRLQSAALDAPVLEAYTPDVDWLPQRDTVTDVQMPAGTFFDLAVVHLLTTATLARLSELYPTGRFEPRRFRPNFVVTPASDEKAFVENDWIGRTLLLGDDVRLRITRACERCVMTTLPQADLPHDSGILRTVVRHNDGNVGVYAEVVRGGTVRRGDAVRLV
jgi:uncharacterized protein